MSMSIGALGVGMQVAIELISVAIELICSQKDNLDLVIEQHQKRLREVYRKCMSIHAAKLGTYASDGCCEYTPDDGQPAAMLCGACGCPHNLHRLAMVTRRWAVVLFVNTP
ncbi:hypothetical protein HU200_020850 [Digitaria exilis]|uniref:ZF-HD dimerization-type domain-containing protein n=1 Tax=Digitaria exilis TaxID=1010633 RepID=A0A835F0K0_9POAL|nr:hypothetical protein HU200_020850 [Digitaria exilis]